jgi:hypothetical protein
VSEDLVWYVAYGSNLLAERFGVYLDGGSFGGITDPCRGCADPSRPRASAPLDVLGRVLFGHYAASWGGGVAFFDETADAVTPARGYLITAGQFEDVWEQEGHTWYGRSVDLGERDGIPMRTFTSPEPVEPSAPSESYLQVIAHGLVEAHGWTMPAISSHLLHLEGVSPQWSPDALRAVLDETPSWLGQAESP